MRGLILAEGVGYKRLVLFVHDVGRGWEVVDHSVEITEAWLGFFVVWTLAFFALRGFSYIISYIIIHSNTHTYTLFQWPFFLVNLG